MVSEIVYNNQELRKYNLIKKHVEKLSKKRYIPFETLIKMISRNICIANQRAGNYFRCIIGNQPSVICSGVLLP